MDKKTLDELFQRKQSEDFIRQEFEQTLPDRVARYLQVKPHEIIPNRHFTGPSTECSRLFRDGHFYGCISLTQAVAEALVRFLCTRNSCKPTKDFAKNVNTLNRRKFITDELKGCLLRIWEGRDDCHHMNPNVKGDREKLEELAREKASLLAKVEGEIFGYKVVAGKLKPDQPKYWDIDGELAMVFLRLEP